MTPINQTNVTILSALLMIYNQLVQQLTNLLKKFWATPGSDPRANVTAMGSLAAAIFGISAAATNFLIFVAQQLGLPTPTIPGVPPCYVLSAPASDGSMTCAAVTAQVPTLLAIAGGVVSWTGAVGMVKYVLQNSVDGGSTWSTLATLGAKDIWTAPSTAFTDNQAASGNQYRVAAVDVTGLQSAFTAPVTA